MKPSFFHDVDLLELSPLHRLLFCGMWCWADREGRLADRPRQIKHDVLPMDVCDIDILLNDLIAKGFVVRYEVDGKKVLEILNFEKHQNPHPKEVPSQLPCKEISCREIKMPVPEKPEPAGLSPIPSFPSVTCHLSPHHADSGVAAVAPPASQETPEEEPLTFQDMSHRWVRRKGLTKPVKTARTKAEELWIKNPLGSTDCDAALDGFVASGWWKTANEPMLGFVKDPRSWIGRAPAPDDDQDTKAAAEAGLRQTPTADAPQAAQIDYPARWNELVPAMKVEWDWERSNVAALRLAELDDVFVARFEEMCRIAQNKHLSCGKEAKWMTFEFAIRRSPKGWGWWRILTEFREMEPRGANSDVGTNPGAWVPGKVCATVEQVRERRAWQEKREAAGKHTDSDKAVREGDLST